MSELLNSLFSGTHPLGGGQPPFRGEDPMLSREEFNSKKRTTWSFQRSTFFLDKEKDSRDYSDVMNLVANGKAKMTFMERGASSGAEGSEEVRTVYVEYFVPYTEIKGRPRN